MLKRLRMLLLENTTMKQKNIYTEPEVIRLWNIVFTEGYEYKQIPVRNWTSKTIWANKFCITYAISKDGCLYKIVTSKEPSTSKLETSRDRWELVRHLDEGIETFVDNHIAAGWHVMKTSKIGSKSHGYNPLKKQEQVEELVRQQAALINFHTSFNPRRDLKIYNEQEEQVRLEQEKLQTEREQKEKEEKRKAELRKLNNWYTQDDNVKQALEWIQEQASNVIETKKKDKKK